MLSSEQPHLLDCSNLGKDVTKVGMSVFLQSPKHFLLNSTGERVVDQKSFHPTQNHYEEPHHCFTSADLKTEVKSLGLQCYALLKSSLASTKEIGKNR